MMTEIVPGVAPITVCPFTFVEAGASAAVHTAHFATPHRPAVLAQASPWLATAPDSRRYGRSG